MELRDYIPKSWKIDPAANVLRVIAPEEELARDFREGAALFLLQTANNLRAVIEIGWEGGTEPIKILPSGQRAKPPSPETVKAKPSFELDLTKLYGFEKCVYINEIATQKNLWCNQAAIAAQGKKPSEFLGATAYELNYEDELQRRMRSLIADQVLTDYSYRALRWTRDESGLWVRKQMSFFSEFHLIEYLGERCWLGIVHQAEETGAHADGVLAAG
jgi:hypothetical protein